VWSKVPGPERTTQKLRELSNGLGDDEVGSHAIRLGNRKIVEEALEAELRDASGRGYYERGAEPGRDDRNGTRTGRFKTADGIVEYGVPQVAVVKRFRDRFPAARACFEDDFEVCVAHLRFPIAHRKFIRTTNLLERLFVEERRRSKIIPNFFHGERPVLQLKYAALIRSSEDWRGIRFTPFESRPLGAIRAEIDQEHAKRTAPAVRSSEVRSPSSSSSKLRTRPGPAATAALAPQGLTICRAARPIGGHGSLGGPPASRDRHAIGRVCRWLVGGEEARKKALGYQGDSGGGGGNRTRVRMASSWRVYVRRRRSISARRVAASGGAGPSSVWFSSPGTTGGVPGTSLLMTPAPR